MCREPGDRNKTLPENVYSRTRTSHFGDYTESCYVEHDGRVAMIDLDLLERLLFDQGFRFERTA